MNQRIQYLKNKIFSYTPILCSERAEQITLAYQETEDQPQIMRRAHAFSRILKNMSIYISERELVVGNQASNPRAAPIFPEFGIHWLEEELEGLPKRQLDKFLVSDKTRRCLRKIFSYWKGETHYDLINSRLNFTLPSPILKMWDRERGYINQVLSNSGTISCGDGHIIVDYPFILKYGLTDVIRKVEASINESKNEDAEKVIFLKAVVTSLQAAICFAKRYSLLAEKLAAQSKDMARKCELGEIAQICQRVPAQPATTFYEALQSCWFIHLLIQIESNGHSISPGRFDQYLYPYYKQDIGKGILSPEGAKELLACFWLKCNEINKIRQWSHTRKMHGYPVFQSLTLGGVRKNGQDATNALSYLCLEITGELKLPQPTVVTRVHRDTRLEYLKKCCFTVAKHGGGQPGFFNDEVAYSMFKKMGIPKKLVWDWAVVGCSEPAIPGRFNNITGSTTHVNLLKVLEITLNNGVNPYTGKGLLVFDNSKDIRKANSFSQILKAYQEQLQAYLEIIPLLDKAVTPVRWELNPTPFLSGLLPARLSSGKDVSFGDKPNFDNTLILGHGSINVGNSLGCLKRLVFTEKKSSLKKMLTILKSNYKGKLGEEIRQYILNNIQKYGNDDDEIDEITRLSLNYFLKGLDRFKPVRGGTFAPSPQTLSANAYTGEYVGATPDGRLRREATADNVSPTAGSDQQGPTAVLKSAASLDQALATNGTILNLKLHPSLVESEDKLEKFAYLIQTYFDLGGYQVQFNIATARTYRLAQKFPQKYRHLVVKVAGYSAFFVDLDKKLQDQIIKRVEYQL